MNYLLDSEETIGEFVRAGGGKAANMARLTQQGFPVPEWFCVGVETYQEFIRLNKLEEKLKPFEPLSEFSKQVEVAFVTGELPSGLKEAVLKKLGELKMENHFVAVRSSGLDEDSKDNSFAGQFSSYLFQKGWDQIAESLKKCWASGFSERALSYRIERGLPLLDIKVGVVIQKMINAESAGVVFSRHPIKVLDRNQVLISSVWGLGEGLVSGELPSDDFEVNRDTSIVTSQIIEKTHAFRQAAKGGVEKLALTNGSKDSPSLSESQVKEIALLSTNLEAKLGSPQDSEWAIEENRIYVVQTRPITNLPPDSFYDKRINGKSLILWDNSNIIESYSGVTSPLTFSFASRAYHQVYVQFCDLMGVPHKLVEEKAPVFRNMLGLLRGRIYYNLANWYQLVLLLPGSGSNKSFMETMMGVRNQIDSEKQDLFAFVDSIPKYSFWKKLNLIGKTLWRFFRINKIIGDFNAHFLKTYEEARKKDYKGMSLPELVDYYHFLDDQLLKRWHAPIINDYLCMIFFGLLKKQTEKWIAQGDAGGSLQNDLLCGEGGLESTEPTKFLMKIADRIDHGDAAFRSWFISEKPEAVWRAFQSNAKPGEARELLLEFLDRYGFRCINELKLEEPDLHDDPAFVIDSVASYIKTKAYNIGDMETRERAIRDTAEKKVKEKLSGLRKTFYFWILGQARKAVKNRENLRFARTKVFGVSRHLFRGMGDRLARLGLLEAESDIFYLTVDEIVAFVEGRGINGDLKPLVAIRKAEFEKYRSTPPPPDRLTTQGAVGASGLWPTVLFQADLNRTADDASADPKLLKGTPCCPGVIEGTVRVVYNPKDAEGLSGEILVTERTDPGWVPLYPSCSGLLIERGSLLSHSAVVARELGLPTIVGVTGGLMQKLKTGQKVRVDAGKGEIRILE